MKQFLLLTKVFFRNGLTTNKKTGNQRNAFISLGLISLLFGLLSAGGITIINFTIYPQGVMPKEKIVMMMLVVSSALTIIMSFFQMHTTLFRCKDYDFLTSLPLGGTKIIGAKLVALSIMNFCFDFFIVLPAFVFYIVKGGHAAGAFTIIVAGLLVSIIPLLFVTIIGSLVAILTVKSKHGDLITTIIYVVFMLLMMVGVVLLTTGPEIARIDFIKVLPYLTWINNVFTTGSLLGLLWYVLLNIGALVLVVVLVGLLYNPLNQMHGVANRTKYIASGKIEKPASLKTLLFKKEVNLVLHNTTLLLNTYIMPLIAMVVGLLLFGFLGHGFTQKDASYAVTTIRTSYITTGLIIAGCAGTTFASFSLEGNSFPLLFVYPLKKMDIIKAKIKASVLPLSALFMITSLITTVVIGCCQGFDIITPMMWVNVILFPALGCGTSTFIGVLCGLKWARFDYVDPNTVVKNSRCLAMSFLFSILINVGAIALNIGLNIVVKSFLNINNPLHAAIVTGSVIAYFAIVFIVVLLVLRKKGEAMFENALHRNF